MPTISALITEEISVTTDEFQIPEDWRLSPQQALVIGSLADAPGSYISAYAFCRALYGKREAKKGMAGPAKLRVLIQRCREILYERSKGSVDILVKRNHGWMLTRADVARMRKLVDLT